MQPHIYSSGGRKADKNFRDLQQTVKQNPFLLFLKLILNAQMIFCA